MSLVMFQKRSINHDFHPKLGFSFETGHAFYSFRTRLTSDEKTLSESDHQRVFENPKVGH